MAVIVLFLGSWQVCVCDEQMTLVLVMFAWLNSVTLLYGYGPTLGRGKVSYSLCHSKLRVRKMMTHESSV